MLTADKKPGNQSKFWNQDVVFQACEKLVKQGTVPTVTAVRRQTGIDGGSHATVQKYVRLFREQEKPTVAPAAPEPLLTALNSIWEQALTAAREDYEFLYANLSQKEFAILEENLSMEALLKSSADKETELTGKLKDLEHENHEQQDLLERQTGAITDLTAANRAAENKLGQAGQEIRSQARTIELLTSQLTAANEMNISLEKSYRDNFDSKIELLKEKIKGVITPENLEKIFPE